MKATIITICEGHNYGNRLQNYALQTVIESLGYTVETMDTSSQSRGIINIWKEKIKLLVKRILGYSNIDVISKRNVAFNCFNNQYIRFVSAKRVKKKCDSDVYICGSDQVWNPTLGFIGNNFLDYFACFAPKNRVISYAASIAIESIPDKYAELFERGIEHIQKISVREKEGQKLLKEKYNKDSEVVLDPTLLLKTEEWELMIDCPSICPEGDFLFYYHLGTAEKYDELIKEYAKENNLYIVEITHENTPGSEIKNCKAFSASPNEFLWYVKKASIVVTDSFHAVVFSIMFQIPFRVFDRKTEFKQNRMSSRIDTLLSICGIDIEAVSIKNIYTRVNQVDYESVKRQIKFEREKSLQFLRNALSDKQGE